MEQRSDAAERKRKQMHTRKDIYYKDGQIHPRPHPHQLMQKLPYYLRVQYH